MHDACLVRAIFLAVHRWLAGACSTIPKNKMNKIYYLTMCDSALMCARTADDAEGRFVTKFSQLLLISVVLPPLFFQFFFRSSLFSRLLGSLLASSVTSCDNPYMNGRRVSSFSIYNTSTNKKIMYTTSSCKQQQTSVAKRNNLDFLCCETSDL